MKTYRSAFDAAKAKAILAMRAAVDALLAIEDVPPNDWPSLADCTRQQSLNEHGVIVADAAAHARILDSFQNLLHSETDMGDEDEADEPAVAGEVDGLPELADRHHAVTLRWARMRALVWATHDALDDFRQVPDVDLLAMMRQLYTAPPRHGHEGDLYDDVRDMYEACFAALFINTRSWLTCSHSYLPTPIVDAADRLKVVVLPAQQPAD